MSKFRRRVEDEQGFTLVELLVVILIIGILAAIAIPSFLSQKGKAHDAAAKAQARTAQTAAETVGTDSSVGGYALVTPAKLKQVEPTLNDTSAGVTLTAAAGTDPTGGAGGTYTVTSHDNATNTDFVISRAADGTVARTCSNAGQNGCPTGGTW